MPRRNCQKATSKCQDQEPLFHGYRYYNATTGRWLNRDPVEEIAFGLSGIVSGSILNLGAQANNVSFVGNNPLTGYDYLGLECKLKSGTTIRVGVQGGGSATITVGPPLSGSDQDAARRGLCILQKLLPHGPRLAPFSDTRWGTFSGLPSQGFTYKGCIFVDELQKPNCSPKNKLELAMTLAHEAVHYYHPRIGDDPDDPKSPDNTINKPALDAFNEAIKDPACGCCGGKWAVENRFQIYVCQCGLAPCKGTPCSKKSY